MKDIDKYSGKYSEKSFWEKLQKFALKAGAKVIYLALLLYYTLKLKDIPFKAKATIIAALGYFISPIDAIPDALIPIGFTDDLGALYLAFTTIVAYIDDEVRNAAKEKIRKWFGDDVEGEIGEYD